jgi:tetratricopeptide (TPR) repeat protein
MPRFDKLEFDDKGDKPATPPPESSTPEPDAKTGPLESVDWLKRADQKRRIGEYESALRFYSRALEDDRSLVDGWLGQIQMLVLLDELPEAELWARKASELFPAQGDLFAARAQAIIRLGDMKRSHEACDGAMNQKGQSAYRWIVRGELMVATRQNTDASCFDRALQLDSDWLTSVEIANIYLYYGYPIKALGRIRRAVDLAPTEFYPWLIQGHCQKSIGLVSQAQHSLRQCLEINPGNFEAEGLLAEMEKTWFFTRWWRRIRHR